MSNNYWNQQPNNNGNQSPPNNGPVRTGGLLRDYRPQPQPGPVQNAPAPRPGNGPSPVSPLPATQAPSSYPAPAQHGQQPQAQPAGSGLLSRNRNNGWVANTVDMVRRWSGKFAAMPQPAPDPLVLYKPPVSTPGPQKNIPKSQPWKRSRTLRIAMRMKQRRMRWQKTGLSSGKLWSGILIAFCLLLVVLTSGGSAYAYSYYQSQLPRLQDIAKQQISQTTRIYDRNWNLLYEMYSGDGRRTPVQYKYIPQVMQLAMTSTEDHSFWDENNYGIDPQGILRAGTEYANKGGVQGGGSTITQQVIKNMTNQKDETLNRKISEAALAIGLTQQYPKWKILEMYFNVAGFGSQDLGVESAVEDYFHLKPQCDSSFNCVPGIYYLNCDADHIKDCNPDQCATSKYCDPLLGLARASLLAGMPQNPVTYDPTLDQTNPVTGNKYYLERQDLVLSQMLKFQVYVPGLGQINQDIINKVEALTAKMQFTPYQRPKRDPHFVDWVISQLSLQLGADTLQNGGFNIRTTIDSNLETYVEKAVHRHIAEPEYQKLIGGMGPLNKTNNLHDAAVIVMDAKTGEILAMDGSFDYWDKTNPKQISGQTNMAIWPRQPGSSMKPIVYATAFQEGWYPGIVLPDVKTYFPKGLPSGTQVAYSNGDPTGNAYNPTDYGGGYSKGRDSIRVATANSHNIPAIKASLYAGLNNVVTTAHRLGISAIPDSDAKNTSFALGTSAVPLIQMVGAYQVFANQGKRIPPRGVLDIWDNYGHHLYRFDPTHPGGTQVLSPQVAYMMTSVLNDEAARAPEFETDHDLSMWDWTLPDGTHPDVGAKTGTTDSFKDNLTLGYTPDAVVGVWTGNADDSAMSTNTIGITGAAPIWHSVVERVMGHCNVDIDNIPCGNFNLGFHDYHFPQPPGVIKACVSSYDGLAGSGNCDWMLQDEYPQSHGLVDLPPSSGNGNGNGGNNNGGGNGNGNGGNGGNNNGGTGGNPPNNGG